MWLIEWHPYWLPLDFSDLEGQFCCLNLFYLSRTSEMQRVLSTITDESESACSW